MSWSISMTGKPHDIQKQLEAHSEALCGYSKVEFDDAKPHLAALVNQNFDNAGREEEKQPTIRLEAFGHGFARAPEGQSEPLEHIQRACTVRISNG